MKNTKTKKFQRLVNLISYGIEFQKHDRDESCESYLNGVIEGTAHIAACMLVQEFGFDCMGTGDLVDFLELDTFPDKDMIEKKLIELFEFEDN
jgi:hypothetical protein